MHAAAAAARESASYFGSSLSPYAAYAAQNMMSSWNSYSMASFQSLQRAGVTYGRIQYNNIFLKTEKTIMRSYGIHF